MKVPFGDLYSQYLTLKDEIDSSIFSSIRSSSFVRGPAVVEFEKNFSIAHNVNHCISCANGTDSLFIALKSLGVSNGDEVIVPAQSWISTSEVVSLCGARPIFCDIDEFHTLDATYLDSLITSKTVGIIPVHLYGQPADMQYIIKFASSRNLWVLEDCAQAHLASINSTFVGSFGSAASFSFYPGKNLGAMGDAGCITTNDQKLSEQMTMFCRHGGLTKGEHLIEGINSRMDTIQASILSIKLKKLPQWTERRRVLANRYIHELSNLDWLSLPTIREGCQHSWHLFVVMTDFRDQLREYLFSHDISSVINYPVILPLLPAYSYLQHKPHDFPVAFRNQSRILSLPLYPEMSDDQQSFAIQTIRNFSPCIY